MSEAHFIYLAETDLSVENGHGINEREFVDAVMRHWPDEVSCVAPAPLYPETYRNPAVEYVASHGRKAAGYPRYLVSAIRRARGLARRHESAAIAFRFGPTPLLPYAFSRMKGPPVVLKTFAPPVALGPNMKLGPVRRGVGALLQPAYRSVVRSALAADTVSTAYRGWICERYRISPDRIAVIPNGANTELFTPGEAEAARSALRLDGFDNVVGYVGALSAIRYLDLLIRGLTRLQAGGSTALVLVGDGPERADLERLARGLGVKDRVLFAGSVPYAAVPQYIRAFDVAVDLTSIEMHIAGRTVLSSFSQKIPQYLACGVPVVAWCCDDTEFLVGNNVGGVAAFRDVSELVALLQSLLDRTTEEGARMAARARALVESRLSATTVARQRLDWWQAAVDRAGEQPRRSDPP